MELNRNIKVFQRKALCISQAYNFWQFSLYDNIMFLVMPLPEVLTELRVIDPAR